MAGEPADHDHAIQEISDWLIAGCLGDVTIEDLLAGYCERLSGIGLALMRGFMAMHVLHPLIDGITTTWRRGEGIAGEHFPPTHEVSEQWRRSPLNAMTEARKTTLRHRLDGDGAWRDFPLLVDLADQGATEYLAMITHFGNPETAWVTHDGMIASWVTDRPGGFSERDIADLERLQPRLAVAAKMAKREQTAVNVVSAYLGTDAGRRVLAGQIKLGDGEVIPAAIWYSDLRGSTPLAARLPGPAFLETLNAYFGCTAGAVLDHGGEVLRFMGDAVLAIFPIAGPGGAERAARSALAAAADAERRMAALNAERVRAGEEPLAFGLGLHVGDILFGNIGVPQRIEFSVIGPAANEVARLEGLSKTLERTVVVSAALARILPLAWRSLGRHRLRGVGDEQEVFAPPEGG